MGYCTEQDLYRFGLPRGNVAHPSRLIGAVDVSANRIALDSHGLSVGDSVQFRSVGGGVLPTPLAEGTDYFVVYASEWQFAVSATLGGTAVDLSAVGGSTAVLARLPIDHVIEKVSHIIDDMVPGCAVPFDPVPEIVRVTCAELAAAMLVSMVGGVPTQPVSTLIDAAQKRLDRWAKGVPVAGATSAQLSSYSRPRRTSVWRRFGGLS
jgi:hypothetical protein